MLYLPLHLDSGNRGCEAITKGTKMIVGNHTEMTAYTRDRQNDEKMGNYGCILRNNKIENEFVHLAYCAARRIVRSEKRKVGLTVKENNRNFLRDIQKTKGNVVLSTGGDMFCYAHNEAVYLNDFFDLKKNVSILWGCSIGEENLTEKKISSLKQFSYITPRESITERLLKEGLGLKNVDLFPDPAFVLKPSPVVLPQYFKTSEVIGINLSNFVNGQVELTTYFGRSLLKLFNYILNNTSLNIVLIPHVFWRGQDDRIICNAVLDKYKESGRVHMAESEQMNYCQIRYLISKCRYFIGARTHSVISAYATYIPALALGYSVKSIGIAKDIGLPNELTVNYKSIVDENQLVDSFIWLQKHEQQIKEILNSNVPDYIQRAYSARQIIEKFI